MGNNWNTISGRVKEAPFQDDNDSVKKFLSSKLLKSNTTRDPFNSSLFSKILWRFGVFFFRCVFSGTKKTISDSF